MSGLQALKQLLLPGVKKARGVERIPGKQGYYAVDPSTANVETKNLLKRASRRAIDEGDLAESPGGVPSIQGRGNARGAYMLGGALNELRYAAEAGGGIGRPVKGVVYVDKNGNIRAGSAINKEKGGEYLEDELLPPNYLEYVATTTPDVRGSDLLRLTQELYGDDMVFQVATPKKNVPIYEAMGARRMPLRGEDDVLGGDEGLPAFRIERRIPERRAQSEDSRQLRIPGFAGGGKVDMDHGARQKEFEKSKKAMRGGLESLGNFAYDMVVPQDSLDVGLMLMGGSFGRLAKKAGAALAGSGASDAEASPLAKALRYVKQAVYKDVPLDTGEFTTMYVNPSESEMARLMNVSRRVADVDGGQAAVRLLRDLRNRDIYAADGNKLLHSDMAGHVPGLTLNEAKTDIWFPDEPQERALNFLRNLPVGKASGGLVEQSKPAASWDIFAAPQ